MTAPRPNFASLNIAVSNNLTMAVANYTVTFQLPVDIISTYVPVPAMQQGAIRIYS
jgi:hypothetical protein